MWLKQCKQCKAAFFCKLTKGTLISWQIFQSCLVLPNTKPLPSGQWQEAIGVLLVNLSNTIGLLLENWSNFETFAKFSPRYMNHLQNLCHLFSIRHQRLVVAFSSLINYNWRIFCTDLQKNIASHCLATCFSH